MCVAKDEALNALLKNRPESSTEKLERTVDAIRTAVAKEVDRAGITGSGDELWREVRDSSEIEEAVRSLLDEVDRRHALYVYSRFKGSPAVGPPVVESALKEVEKR